MNRIRIEIDEYSGFCTGVIRAVKAAEKALEEDGRLYSLGELVHNPIEVERLKGKGLETIDCERLNELKNETVLIRAHGEPPTTYEKAAERNIRLIDATCPIVTKLQKKIAETQHQLGAQGSILIYGKPGHPEVRSLVGQTGGKALVSNKAEEIDSLDLHPPIHLFSQTTMPVKGYEVFREALVAHMNASGWDPDTALTVHDTVCRQVADRENRIRHFAAQHDLVIFVSGRESSNGKALFEVCRAINPRSIFIAESAELRSLSFEGAERIGICGATSTPHWMLTGIRDQLMAELNITES